MKIKMILPPPNTTIRLLVLDFLSRALHIITKLGTIDIYVIDTDTIEFEAPDTDTFRTTLEDMLKSIGIELEARINNVLDFSIHRNDKEKLSQILGRQIGTGEKFMHVLVEILKNASLTPQDLMDLSKISISGRKTLSIVMGAKNFPLPQCAAFDRYESRYEFPKGRYGGKIEIRMSKIWYLIILAGIALSYLGAKVVKKGTLELYFVHVPFNLLEFYAIDPTILELIHGNNGIVPFLKHLTGVYPNRMIPYIIYISCEVAKRLKQSKELLNLYLDKLPEIIFDRVMTTGRAYTLIERYPVFLRGLIDELSKFDDYVLNEISRCAQRALWDKDFEYHLNFITKLYLTLSGSTGIYDAIYYYGRVLIEKEIETADDKKKSMIRQKMMKFLKKILNLSE